MHVEGPQGILIEGGDEDHLGHRHRRRRVRPAREHLEAVQLRHLHVEKHQLHGIPDPASGRMASAPRPAAGAGHQLRPAVARKQAANTLAARLFVVHDQRTNRPQGRHHYRGTPADPACNPDFHAAGSGN